MAFNNYLEDENDKPYFTTNSLAYYYDKMEGFAKAVEGSVKALNLTKEEVEKRITLYIEQNKNELDQRLAQWDGKLETFDSSVETLLSEWVDDGTLTHVIDSTLIDQKIAPVALQLVETGAEIDSVRDFKNFEVSDKGRSINNGAVTCFVDDDGKRPLYNDLYPIFKSEGIPICAAVVPTWVGVESATKEQLLEMQSDGHEIMSHTHTHPRLSQLTEEELDFELSESKKWLKENGFVVNNFVLPFGDYTDRERNYVKKHYRSMRVSDAGYATKTNIPPITTYELKSHWLGEGLDITDSESGFKRDTFDYYKYYIDKANVEGSMLIISTHATNVRNNNFLGLLQQVVQYAKANTRVLTVNDALNEFGNIVEVGDYSENKESLNYFAVSSNGDVTRNGLDFKYLGDNQIIGNEDIKAFESYKVSFSKLLNAHVANSQYLPGESGGIIYIYNMNKNWRDQNFSFAIFETVGGKRYRRRFYDVPTGDYWGGWIEQVSELKPETTSISTTNQYLPSTSIMGIPKGIHHTMFDKASATGAPFDAAGTLSTYKLNTSTSQQFYNYQLITRISTGETWKRSFAADGTPSVWVRVTAGIELTGQIGWNPVNLQNGTGEVSADITVTGASMGDYVIASSPIDLQGIMMSAYVSTANTVKIRLQNGTGSDIDLPGGTFKVKVTKA